jgi:ribosomal-protein-alanine N-acetyltransferase
MYRILEEGYITNIAVFEKYRRMGVAKALLTALDCYAAQQRLAMITLEVRVGNLPAICLYRSFGYNEKGAGKIFIPGQPKMPSL